MWLITTLKTNLLRDFQMFLKINCLLSLDKNKYIYTNKWDPVPKPVSVSVL